MAETEVYIHSTLLGVSLDLSTFLILIAAFLVAVHIQAILQKPKNLPPGPWGVPVLGAIPFLGKKPYVTLQKWWRKYGDVYTMYMGTRLVMVVNGVEMMKECLVRQGDNFTGRPWNYFKKITQNTGLVFTDGEVWREHRRFTLSCLRDFGMGKINLENKINEEANYLLKEFDSKDGKPFELGKMVYKAVSNIICSTIYGSRFDYDDKVFQANIDALDQSARNHSLLGMINFLPFLEFLPKILPKSKELHKNVQMRDSYAAFQIDHHQKSFDADNPRDLIDAYLSRMYKLQKQESHTTLAKCQLKRTIQDLFITGSETLNTTLKWAILFMAWNQDVQKKVQQEIDHVIGGRCPSMNDRSKMPYTEATIMECQRLGNIALLSIPRCTLESTKVMGYDIPKGTWVFINRWGTHASARYWKNPSEFNPNRFIGKNGGIKKPDAFIPFGMGPRSCIGETFARMELFLFFTHILQTFSLILPDEGITPILEPTPGINMPPQPYQIIARHR